MTLSQGQILNNRYRIAKSRGQGGFSAVYRAWDLNLNSPCALKENLETSPKIRERYKKRKGMDHTRHTNPSRLYTPIDPLHQSLFHKPNAV